jgi:hypothetical protein
MKAAGLPLDVVEEATTRTPSGRPARRAPNGTLLCLGNTDAPTRSTNPWGKKQAEKLAQALRLDHKMPLTDEQYQCLIGRPGPLHPFREQIFLCSIDLTNSNGHAVAPLSSYGLSLDEQRVVRSVCASDGTFEAVCLKANDIFAGPLDAIADECGFTDKWQRLKTETPLREFILQGHDGQTEWAGACIAEAACRGKGPESRDGCAAPLATQ